MLCDDCKKREAIYHSITKINGIKKERHLCAECYKKSTNKISDDFEYTTGLGGLGGLIGSFASNLFGEQRNELICATCGSSAIEFERTGRIGCANCYKEFADVVLPVIQKMQGGDISHVGKAPLGNKASITIQYERLKKELDDAIKVENFEQATVIRDRMRQLKNSAQEENV